MKPSWQAQRERIRQVGAGFIGELDHRAQPAPPLVTWPCAHQNQPSDTMAAAGRTFLVVMA